MKDQTLILLRRKGTSGINDPSSRLQHGGGQVKDLLLPCGAHSHMLLAPLVSGFLILSEHPFPGAGGIHCDLVEKLWKTNCQAPGVLIGHHSISDAHPLYILGKDPGPGRMDLVG